MKTEEFLEFVQRNLENKIWVTTLSNCDQDISKWSWYPTDIIELNTTIPTKHEEIHTWCIKYCKGKFRVWSWKFWAFENSTDAMIFKLRWG